jgi:arylsulfatase
VGSVTFTDVSDVEYQLPSKFTRTLNKLSIKLDRPKLSAIVIGHSYRLLT